MTYHILNGDCLAEQLIQTAIDGQRIVCRECLIEGGLAGDTLSEFWETRARFISSDYHTTREGYYDKSVSEFEKVIGLPEGSEVSLWFEDDLFCQVNLWFVLSLLDREQKSHRIFRVFPFIENEDDQWRGFGNSTAVQLERAFTTKIQFETEDIRLGIELWNAYKSAHLSQLVALSVQSSPCFHRLKEVCQAHLERFPKNNNLGRPEKVVKELIEENGEFSSCIFKIFGDGRNIWVWRFASKGNLRKTTWGQEQMNHTTNYINTFIEVAVDSSAQVGIIPKSKGDKKTIAEMQYFLVVSNPYKLSSDDIFFQVYADRKNLSPADYHSARAEFFSKGQPCFRASPLTKKFGFGVHSNHDGKVAIYGIETAEYQKFLNDESVKKVRAMRASSK